MTVLCRRHNYYYTFTSRHSIICFPIVCMSKGIDMMFPMDLKLPWSRINRDEMLYTRSKSGWPQGGFWRVKLIKNLVLLSIFNPFICVTLDFIGSHLNYTINPIALCFRLSSQKTNNNKPVSVKFLNVCYDTNLLLLESTKKRDLTYLNNVTDERETFSLTLEDIYSCYRIIYHKFSTRSKPCRYISKLYITVNKIALINKARLTPNSLLYSCVVYILNGFVFRFCSVQPLQFRRLILLLIINLIILLFNFLTRIINCYSTTEGVK